MSMADEFLVAFLSDVRSVVYGIFSVVQLFFGICYMCGKTLSESLVYCLTSVSAFLSEFFTVSKLLILQIVEFEQQVFRALLLIYYGAGKVAEAFYITFTDLASISCHMACSLSELAQKMTDFVGTSLLSLSVVPGQLCDALALLGEFVFGSCVTAGTGLLYVLRLLLWTPVHAFLLLGHLFVQLLQVPQKFIARVPTSAYIGLGALALAYFIYCRFSFRRFFRSVFGLVRRAFELIQRLIQFSGRRLRISWSSNGGVRVDDAKSGGSGADGGPAASLKGLCVICFETPVAYIANPCSHVSLCRECVHRLVKFDSRCPMCRNTVESYHRVYIS